TTCWPDARRIGGRRRVLRDDRVTTTNSVHITIGLVGIREQYASLKSEIDAAIAQVVERGVFVGGPELEELERWFASFIGVRHAIGVGSGTAAIELTLRALGIGRGDEVITAANTFIATAAAISAAGARPVLVDVVEATGNIDPARIAAAVTPRTKAILPVHLYGRPAAMEEIAAAAGDVP